MCVPTPKTHSIALTPKVTEWLHLAQNFNQPHVHSYSNTCNANFSNHPFYIIASAMDNFTRARVISQKFFVKNLESILSQCRCHTY